MAQPSQIPVTVLTGFLGAGKTTLLNRVLTENHGKKYAVIVNEFGEVGIDNDLVVGADEEVFEMTNGCICCTVRGDLIRIIGGLMKRRGGFDGIPDIEYIQAIAPSQARGNQYHGRIDYFLTPRDQIFGSVFFSKLDQTGTDVGTGGRPDSDVPFKPFNHTGTAAYIHTFSANLLNELRANYTRFADNGIKDATGATNWGIPRIGIQNFPSGNSINIGAPQASTPRPRWRRTPMKCATWSRKSSGRTRSASAASSAWSFM